MQERDDGDLDACTAVSGAYGCLMEDLNVEASDTIDKLKDETQAWTLEHTDDEILPHMCTLCFAGEILDGGRTFVDYNIDLGKQILYVMVDYKALLGTKDKIHIVQIFVKTMTCGTITVDVS